jgi:hypothetical protein
MSDAQKGPCLGQSGFQDARSRSELKVFRLVLLVAFGLLSLAANQPERTRHSPEAHRTGATLPVSAAPSPLTPRGVISNSPNHRPCKGNPEDYQSELCAQWTATQAAVKSAEWAELATYVAVASLVLSLIGLLALVRTLRQSDKTLRLAQKERASSTRRALASDKEAKFALGIAERNAITAEAQVSISKNTARQQLRAYVLLDTTTVEIRADGTSIIRLRFRNTGTTPALKMSIVARTSGGLTGQQVETPAQLVEGGSVFSVGAGSYRLKNVGPLTAEQTRALETGETFVIIYGRGEYDDIFGSRHWFDFRLRGGGQDDYIGGQALTVDSHGNEEGTYPSATN